MKIEKRVFTVGYNDRWGNYKETDTVFWACNSMGPFKAKWQAEKYGTTGEHSGNIWKAWPQDSDFQITSPIGSKAG